MAMHRIYAFVGFGMTAAFSILVMFNISRTPMMESMRLDQEEIQAAPGREPEKYLTLWLHQVHSWFDDKGNGKEKVRTFIQEAKLSGFNSIMTNLPWAWTEREAEHEIRLDTFDKDFMDIVCEENLKLHVLISLHEFPPWVSAERIASQNYSEEGSTHPSCSKLPCPPSPSLAHPEVWQLITRFFGETVWKLTAKYGDCIETISPTSSNEFETRYTQMFDRMRDYSFHMVDAYRKWQERQGLIPIDPFQYPCYAVCRPIVDQSDSLHRWPEFRQEFLAKKYETLCFLVHTAWNLGSNRTKRPACLLHFGEFFATTEVLNSNLFFYLARSPVVDHVIMDSNMALLGAPSSPSIVGVMVSTARAYKKIVHYEAATERVFPCTDNGKLQQVQNSSVLKAGARLLQEGLRNAIDAGVDCLGITNLCAPKAAVDMVPATSRKIAPVDLEAVIYVPYGAFFSWSFVMSGTTCGASPTECWLPEFAQLPIFGRARGSPNGTCGMDVAQRPLLKLWEELRRHYTNIQVVGDASMFENIPLGQASRRVFLRYACVMRKEKWDFPGGPRQKQLFEDLALKKVDFEEIVVSQDLCDQPAHE